MPNPKKVRRNPPLSAPYKKGESFASSVKKSAKELIRHGAHAIGGMTGKARDELKKKKAKKSLY